MEGTAFRIAVPVSKSIANADTGEILHHGIASHEALDLQGERVPTDLLAKSYGYLERHGKFNWDHHSEDIGDVLSISRVTPEEAQELLGVQITGGGTLTKSNVYGMVEDSVTDAGGNRRSVVLGGEDLRTARHRLLSGARLAYSIDGMAVKKSTGEFQTIFVPRIAICPQPIVPNSVCRVVVKSLNGAMEHVGVSDADLPHILADLQDAPAILIDCDGMGKSVQSAQLIISKALFGALVRSSFGPRKAPPMGQLSRALKALKKEAR